MDADNKSVKTVGAISAVFPGFRLFIGENNEPKTLIIADENSNIVARLRVVDGILNVTFNNKVNKVKLELFGNK